MSAVAVLLLKIVLELLGELPFERSLEPLVVEGVELELVGGVGSPAILDGFVPLHVGVIPFLVGRIGVPGVGDLGTVGGGTRHDDGVDVWTWTCGRGCVDVDVRRLELELGRGSRAWAEAKMWRKVGLGLGN